MRTDRRNFILAAGEQLVDLVLPPNRVPQASSPYKPDEARERLLPRAETAAAKLRLAPPDAMPQGEAVAALTLHPQFLSKSAFPADLLKEMGLRAIGSKPDRVTPDRVARKSEPFDEATSTLFVAGKLAAFDRFADQLRGPISRIPERAREELTAVEDFRAIVPEERISNIVTINASQLLECVIYARSEQLDPSIVKGFEDYALRLGFSINRRSELFASGLCFMAVSGDTAKVHDLAWFSFLRRVRAMPRMRPLFPTSIVRSSSNALVVLPDEDALALDIKAAVFDSPLPAGHALGRWVTHFDYPVTAFPDDADNLHGLCVSSAAVVGPLDNLVGGASPYSVDHHGVFGDDPTGDQYLSALKTIQQQVLKHDYKLFNISFGPDYGIADGDVDSFTAVIDELVADGSRLAFIAVGNTGEEDDAAQLNRIQPPSDAVNAISVGAADSRRSDWKRASYSSVGPGRLGCRIKPDIMSFGGSPNERFGCIGPGANPIRYDVLGTSFASPASMRVAGMLLAAMSDQVSAIAVKALTIHGCKLDERDRREVGHGLIETDLSRLLTSEDCEVKVLFQGNLAAGKYVRHLIPLPPDLEGRVEIDATLCYASPVDPDFPSTYVQAGIESIFRPHTGRFNLNKNADGTTRVSTTVRSEPLFNQGSVYGTPDDRRDAHLWDTVLRTRKTKLARCLQQPSVELHYNRRQSGQPTTGARQPDINYALVFTIRCRAVTDLYDQVRARYGANVRVLAPRIEIPIRV